MIIDGRAQFELHRGVFTRLSRCCFLAASGLLVGLLTHSVTQAGFVAGSYRVDIAESERLLDAMLKEQRGEISEAQLEEIEHQEMCRNPSARLIDRNRPAILLQNTSDASSDNELSQFTIDLEQFGYEFGNGDFSPDIFDNSLTYLSNKSDAGISINSSYGTVSDTDLTLDPTKLVLDIEGLTAGKSVIFRFDIDPVHDLDFLYPDYRMVVLGADAGDGLSDPALISATFASGSGDERMTSSTPYSDFTREFGDTITSGLIENYGLQHEPEMHTQSGSTIIPEPSAGLLLLLGLGFVSRSRWHRKLR